MLTHERLKKLLEYDTESGLFRWLTRRGSAEPGDVAGSIKRDGYRLIGIDGCVHTAARLAWFYIHGEWPNHEIDHINGNRDDNRIENLRDVTNRENGQNRVSHRRGKLVGATKNRGRWQSRINVNGVLKHIGMFTTEEEAHEAYLEALAEYKGEK